MSTGSIESGDICEPQGSLYGDEAHDFRVLLQSLNLSCRIRAGCSSEALRILGYVDVGQRSGGNYFSPSPRSTVGGAPFTFT
jgi:hypothetical protein